MIWKRVEILRKYGHTVVKGRFSLFQPQMAGTTQLPGITQGQDQQKKTAWLALDNQTSKIFHHRALNAFIEGAPLVSGESQSVWCIWKPGDSYLLYSMHGGGLQVDLRGTTGRFNASWIDPRNGKLTPLTPADTIEAGKILTFDTPDSNDWALWLEAAE